MTAEYFETGETPYDFEPEPEPVECTCEVGVSSMNDACAYCREEFELWCEDMEASGIIGPYEPMVEEPVFERMAA